jgi:hypothetical protein
VIDAAQADSLASILAFRGDSMAACKSSDWLSDFTKVPDDAAVPLAMSTTHPRAVGSYGAECIEWARTELGIALRWWQALAVTRQLEHDAEGALVWREIVETGPRRIGKSVRLRVVALWRVTNAERIGETQLAMLVSKDLAVGKEIHRGSWRWAEQKGWKVTRLNGGQEVEAPGENRWLLRADTAVYGYDVGYGQVDESWGVDPASITDGLEPALLERFWPQLHLTSTAHVKATSLMRRRLTAALRNADPDVLLLMWGAPPAADLSLESTWRAASPHWSADRRALIGRKYAAAMAGQDEPEFDDPDPIRGWAAQYLNVWPLLLGSQTQELIMPNWHLCAVSRQPPPVVSLGISLDLNRIWLCVGAYGKDGDRRHLGAVSKRRLDTDRVQVISEIKRIQDQRGCAVVIDRKDEAASLQEDLELAGVTLTWLGLDDYVDACADLYDAVAAKEIEHGDYPELNDAVTSAAWRKVGQRKVWTDAPMLKAVTMAFGAPDETFNVW